MKNLSTFVKESCINEKLKLSDINKDNLYDSEWVPARMFKYNKFELGNVLETTMYRYILVRSELAEEALRAPLLTRTNPKDEYIFMRLKDNRKFGFFELYSYKNTFPKTDSENKNLEAVQILPIQKDYKNVKELEKDLEKLHTL